MKYLKYFEELVSYDYDFIFKILKKNHGWGNGCLNYIEQFEKNSEYFFNPEDSNDYVNQFHVFLTDLQTGRLRGDFHKEPSGLRQGVWKMSIPVRQTTSIYNKLT